MAYETTPQVRARLRSERKRRNWDIPRMAQELRNAAEHPHKMPSTASIQRNIERWESGKVKRITERNRILYSRALSIPEDELFEDKPTQAPPELAEGDLDVINKMLGALTSTDRQFGGSYAREYAADFLAAVIEPRLRGHIRGSTRRQLFAASTEFTMRVSAMHLDSDQPSLSLALLGKAASMASESDETSLTAWVLSRRGEHEVHQASLLGHNDVKHAAHVEQALAYMEGAVGVARSAPPMSRAFISAKHALAWSMTGDRARTQRALGTVWDAYDRVGAAEEPRWISAYDWGNLRHEESRCYINLNMGWRPESGVNGRARVPFHGDVKRWR